MLPRLGCVDADDEHIGLLAKAGATASAFNDGFFTMLSLPVIERTSETVIAPSKDQFWRGVAER